MGRFPCTCASTGPAQHEDERKPEYVSRRSRLPGGVRTNVDAEDKHVCPAVMRFGHAELEIASLVAAEREPGQIVPLDEELEPQVLRDPRTLL